MQRQCPRFLKLMLLPVILLSTVGWVCHDDDSNPDDVNVEADDQCPYFDRDCDNMSNATETNDANAYLFLNPDWPDPNPSVARSTPCNGDIGSALNLMDAGVGYYHYNPEQDTDDWGVLHLLATIEYACIKFHRANLTPPRVGTGDLSRGNLQTLVFGGPFPPHNCHENGLEVDIRYIRKLGEEGALDLSTDVEYHDEYKTGRLFDFLIATRRVDLIYYDQVNAPTLHRPGITQHLAGHSDHFHVRIDDPDGTWNK